MHGERATEQRIIPTCGGTQRRANSRRRPHQALGAGDAGDRAAADVRAVAGPDADVISHYDAQGPAWYWNILHLGEHTGTHFDAPIHWVTGKDLPDNARHHPRASSSARPASSMYSGSGPESGFPADAGARPGLGDQYGHIPAGRGCCCGLIGPRARPRGLPNVGDDGAALAGVSKECSEFLAHERDVWALASRPSAPTRAGGSLRPAVPEPHDDARRGQVRPRQPAQPGSAAADRCGGHCRSAQDRGWFGQPVACVRARAALIPSQNARRLPHTDSSPAPDCDPKPLYRAGGFWYSRQYAPCPDVVGMSARKEARGGGVAMGRVRCGRVARGAVACEWYEWYGERPRRNRNSRACGVDGAPTKPLATHWRVHGGAGPAKRRVAWFWR